MTFYLINQQTNSYTNYNGTSRCIVSVKLHSSARLLGRVILWITNMMVDKEGIIDTEILPC